MVGRPQGKGPPYIREGSRVLMGRTFWCVTTWAAALLGAGGGGFAKVQPPQNAGEEKRFIVVLEDDVSSSRSVADAHARRYGAAVTNVYSHALNGYAAKVPEQGVQGIRKDPRVAFVEQDYMQHAADQKLPTGINRIEGDLSSTIAGNGLDDGIDDTVNADIAVLDTGIQKDHPDLNVAGGYNCTSSIRSNYGDGHGHGTHVAGIAAAKDDNTGNSFFDSYHRAICNSTNAGVTYAVAAGNSNTDLKNSRPATYDQVLAVTAVSAFNGVAGGGAAATCRADVDDTSADFSNFTTVGHTDANHTIAAPGVCIESTWKGSTYNTISGTSMASPHAAGTAALCIAKRDVDGDGIFETNGPCTGMTPSQVISKLRSDAEGQPASYGFTDDPNTPN